MKEELEQSELGVLEEPVLKKEKFNHNTMDTPTPNNHTTNQKMDQPTVAKSSNNGGKDPASAQTHQNGHQVVIKEETKKKANPVRRLITILVLLAIVIGGSAYGYQKYVFGQSHEDTDDAQIDASITPVLPRIAGYVTKILVEDNQRVEAGAPLVVLDTRELQIKVQNAEAALRTAEAAVTVARANVNTAEVSERKALSDLERDRKLLEGNALTKQQFDITRTASETAAAQLATARDQIGVAEAQVSQRKAELDLAKLQLSYGTITAPISGIVSKKNVEVGQYVQASQPLMALSENNDVWITANFKETQIEQLKPNQPVEFHVDAYPDVTFQGRVESLSPATGAKFALLPPDNATGNFVKVVQRVPVKIAITGPVNSKYPLRPGMSAEVIVTTK